nr:hypothetical protein [uncultured Desulfobacter sp.]
MKCCISFVELNTTIDTIWSNELSTATNQDVIKKLTELYQEVFTHDGHGNIRVEMKILRRGQKEVIIYCGKQYRFVVDFANTAQTVRRASGPTDIKQACESGFDA